MKDVFPFIKKPLTLASVLMIPTAAMLSGCQSAAPVATMIADQMVALEVNKQAHQDAEQAGQQSSQPRYEKMAVAKKNSNLRAGPGTKNKKIGRLSAGDEMRVLDSQGKWLKISADTARGTIDGWIYAPLVKVTTQRVEPSYSSASSSGNSSQSRSRKNDPLGALSNIYYAGYSKDFLPVKQMMKTGNLKGVENFFAKREKKIRQETTDEYQLMKKIGLLRWMERGTLGLDIGKLDNAVKGFENAETIINVREQGSHATDLLSGIMGFTAETLTGNEEFLEYPGEGYEKVLMLNYKSIAYLLDGKRKAYNTTRRAIDWQNIEKEKFQEKIAKAKEEARSQSSSTTDDGWKKHYKKYDKIANKVASAYVNPFGYYVAGMVQEFESKDDRSLRDNARISYEKALELNPDSKVIAQAAKDMKKKYDKSKRLVHVVVGEGFVPEKKMLVYNIPSNNGVVPVKLTLYEPIASKVARIEVQTTSGKRLGRLSTVADVEAITMRNQKDSEGYRTLRVALSIARAIGINSATRNLGVFGSLVGSAVNSLGAPDMRSWMSLPARLQAARLKISKNISKVKIVSYDKGGRRLASRTVKINKGNDNFIYARSIDKQMYTIDGRPLWL